VATEEEEEEEAEAMAVDVVDQEAEAMAVDVVDQEDHQEVEAENSYFSERDYLDSPQL
jgi:hypothetical protein